MESPTPYLTADGSHSLRSARFGVSYHSSHGALQESEHIFIRAGVDHLLLTTPPGTALRILEMGFGTGLNALLVRKLAAAHPDIPFHYLTFEQFPVSLAVSAALNYTRALGLPEDSLQELHRTAWETTHQLDPNFAFRKVKQDFLAATPPGDFPADLIFYDAFAPENQPELWTVAAMEGCRRWLRPGGILVTYCAKGQFKRNLRAAGFGVEALPGPVGKREITRAVAGS